MTDAIFPSLELQDLLRCAEDAARAAGSHAFEQRHRRKEVVRATAHDVKLRLDLECQAIAENVIRSRFANHSIFGEESGGKADANAAVLWIIDPIDGTVNFHHGLPLWCCSVAALSGGKPIVGVVFAPELQECYTACRGGKALCNGKPISVSETRRIQDAIVATGIDRKTRDLSESTRFLKNLAIRVQRPRIMGSAALDICNVASGRADGYYESGIYLWDAAAGSVIVDRAGGRSEILWRGDDLQIAFLATNGHIHDELRQVVLSTQ